MVFAVLVVWAGMVATGAEAKKSKKEKEPGGIDLFDATNVVRINIELTESDIATLRGTGWGGGRRGGGDDRPVVSATVSDGSRVYTNVAVHLKGAAGSFRPIDGTKPAFTLNFDKNSPGQTFHGLHKISLNNSVQDKTFICEKISRELFHAAGVPVPRADYAVVYVNGQLKGFYVLLEGYNKQFLRRYFKDVSGNLYDGGFCQDVTERLNVNSGDKPGDHSDLRVLISSAVRARQNNRLDDLSKILDIDRFISMVAMESITCHWDGYTMNRNNYRVYHDMDSGKMIFMPHGMDQMFATGSSQNGRANPRMSIFPHLNGVVSQATVGSAEGRAKFVRRIRELSTNVFNAEAVVKRINEIEARILPVIAEIRPTAVPAHRSAVTELCDNIEERARSLEQQLGGGTTGTPPEFDINGLYTVTNNWSARRESGSAVLDMPMTKSGKKLLHIAADQGPAAASWRTKVSLKPGAYRFEAVGMTRDVDEGGNQGADIRVSGGTAKQRLSGNSEWKQLTYKFEVQEESSDVELICELKADKGHAWFNPLSLRLRRIE
ncbi:MAG TPA: CotH kinase family protein [Verrucomicrobiae bacterium]|nr:CotH kinase family protein [Verrucomicrobiae bacterium]